MAEVQGSCEPRFEAVRDTFAANFDQGLDVGASVAVYLDGEPVVDLWGGFVDEQKTVPWERDTIINVWSTTKTMTFLCTLVLADQGELDFSAPVARYWPEFKAGGKEGVEVRHLMSHSAGLSGWQEPLLLEGLYDWDLATSRLAAQEPWWEPGSAPGYHAVTQGYLIGEVVRRITGQSIGKFFHDEVAEPLGGDFFIGTPPEVDSRVALVIPPEHTPTEGDLGRDTIAWRTFSNPPLHPSVATTVPWRRAEIPAANGHGNARSVAAIQSVLAGGGEARGVRLFSAATAERVLEQQVSGTDLVLGVPARFGLGYGLSTEEMPIGPRTCYWGGYGGSVIVIDLENNLTVAYVMNRMDSGLVGDLRGASLVLAAAGGVAQ